MAESTKTEREARAEELDSSRDESAPEEIEEVDEEALERRREALAQLVQYGDPILRSKASPVTEFSDALRQEIERMTELMIDGMGVGLAATQVGTLRRYLVFQAGPDSEPQALVNPRIEWVSEETEVAEEGCLSIPRVSLDVERPLHARIQGQDEWGERVEVEASGLEARVLQHEIDHLDGVLILDRAPRGQRRAALRALRRGEAYHPPDDTDGSEAEVV